ncbi:hypothetical protein [Streptomyces sp. NPDC057939]|uniref:hypothetical protein n=1 Tax=Streptomyces sp. NPDC057939 TaxID=3346284 RepID=UPI0036E3E738
MNTEPCVECGYTPELLDEDLTCGPCRDYLGEILNSSELKRWTVSALHNEDAEVLLISGVFAGHLHDESSELYTTDNLYRFLQFVEARTADEAELLVLSEFDAGLAEMRAEAEEVAA